MQRLFRLLPPFAVALLLASCDAIFGPGDDPITGLPRELSIAEGKLIEADNRLAFKLFREVSEQAADSNVFISPLSVAMALGMTYNGAAGTTQEAMQQTLGLEGMTLEEVNQSYRDLIDLLRSLDSRVEFLLANSIWYRLGMTFEQAFLDLNREFFDAEVTALDFSDPAAGQTINGWVSEKTRGKIEEIVPEQIPWNVVMYLINAIYFKGDWTYQFDKSRTEAARFTLVDGSETTVEMMSHEGEVRIRLAWADGVQLAELPYGGGAYSMTVLLPENAAQIHSLVDLLSWESWDAWLAELDSGEVHVSLPKFRLEYEIGLNEVLKALGMAIAFVPGEADFTRMYAPGGLWIDSVVHKTFVDVNEEGTEAAAVTVVSMRDVAGPPGFIVDRPFVFVIREKFSGTILFMGKVMDPTAG